MKNLSIVIVAFVASALTLSSCTRKDNTDPVPVYPTNTDTNITNSSNLKFTSDTIVADSNGTFNIPATSSNVLSYVTITPDTNITITNSGVSVSYAKKHSSFYGYSKVSVSVSDGTNTISKNLVVKVGSSAQIKTYNILKPYFNKITSLVGFNENSYVYSGNQSRFYGTVKNHAKYKILSNGNLALFNDDYSYCNVIYTVSNTTVYVKGAYQILFTNTNGLGGIYDFDMYLDVQNYN